MSVNNHTPLTVHSALIFLCNLHDGFFSTEGRPLVVMDEPEQSLDIQAEHKMWQQILAADFSKVQVIVATHSIYPILHPDGFHIIEAAPNYFNEVRSYIK